MNRAMGPGLLFMMLFAGVPIAIPSNSLKFVRSYAHLHTRTHTITQPLTTLTFVKTVRPLRGRKPTTTVPPPTASPTQTPEAETVPTGTSAFPPYGEGTKLEYITAMARNIGEAVAASLANLYGRAQLAPPSFSSSAYRIQGHSYHDTKLQNTENAIYLESDLLRVNPGEQWIPEDPDPLYHIAETRDVWVHQCRLAYMGLFALVCGLSISPPYYSSLIQFAACLGHFIAWCFAAFAEDPIYRINGLLATCTLSVISVSSQSRLILSLKKESRVLWILISSGLVWAPSFFIQKLPIHASSYIPSHQSYTLLPGGGHVSHTEGKLHRQGLGPYWDTRSVGVGLSERALARGSLGEIQWLFFILGLDIATIVLCMYLHRRETAGGGALSSAYSILPSFSLSPYEPGRSVPSSTYASAHAPPFLHPTESSRPSVGGPPNRAPPGQGSQPGRLSVSSALTPNHAPSAEESRMLLPRGNEGTSEFMTPSGSLRTSITDSTAGFVSAGLVSMDQASSVGRRRETVWGTPKGSRESGDWDGPPFARIPEHVAVHPVASAEEELYDLKDDDETPRRHHVPAATETATHKQAAADGLAEDVSGDQSSEDPRNMAVIEILPTTETEHSEEVDLIHLQDESETSLLPRLSVSNLSMFQAARESIINFTRTSISSVRRMSRASLIMVGSAYDTLLPSRSSLWSAQMMPPMDSDDHSLKFVQRPVYFLTYATGLYPYEPSSSLVGVSNWLIGTVVYAFWTCAMLLFLCQSFILFTHSLTTHQNFQLLHYAYVLLTPIILLTCGVDSPRQAFGVYGFLAIGSFANFWLPVSRICQLINVCIFWPLLTVFPTCNVAAIRVIFGDSDRGYALSVGVLLLCCMWCCVFNGFLCEYFCRGTWANEEEGWIWIFEGLWMWRLICTVQCTCVGVSIVYVYSRIKNAAIEATPFSAPFRYFRRKSTDTWSHPPVEAPTDHRSSSIVSTIPPPQLSPP